MGTIWTESANPAESEAGAGRRSRPSTGWRSASQHDLRAPLASMHGYVESLRMKRATLSDVDYT